MKKGFRIFAVFMLVISAFVVSACSKKEKNVVSVSVDLSTIPQFVYVGEFDDAKIKATVLYDDDSTETITITSEMLGENAEYLNQAGIWPLEFTYGGITATFSITVKNIPNLYVVKFYNGNNELVTSEIVEEGEGAHEPSYQKVQMSGYTFVGWDRTFNNITENINVYAIYAKVAAAK